MDGDTTIMRNDETSDNPNTITYSQTKEKLNI